MSQPEGTRVILPPAPAAKAPPPSTAAAATGAPKPPPTTATTTPATVAAAATTATTVPSSASPPTPSPSHAATTPATVAASTTSTADPAPATRTSTTTTSVAAAAEEEDLLRDVLDELDKERTKRAQVEADLRQVHQSYQSLQEQMVQMQQQQQQQSSTHKKEKEQAEVSRHAFLAMEAQVKGFQQIVDALTLGKPAIAAAAKCTATKSSSGSSSQAVARHHPKTLPLHVVRLLEVLPWDPRAREHIFGTEVIYEWQVYEPNQQGSATTGKGDWNWQYHMRYFPARFKNLPLAKTITPARKSSDGGNTSSSSADATTLLQFLAGGAVADKIHSKVSKHGVLTDARVAHILKIEEGYPLPADGGQWEWVGGWRIEKRVVQNATPAAATTTTTTKHRVDCDDDGWSYASKVQDFEESPTELVWDNPGTTSKGVVTRKIRRRQWTRQRVLVDYPFCSERTKQYLKLVAENARLTITANKMSDQLVETKTKLTETEEAMMQLKEETSLQIAKLTSEIKQQQELLQAAALAGGSTAVNAKGGAIASSQAPVNRIQEFLPNKDQVKNVGSKISQWVATRKFSDDMAGSTGSLPDDTATFMNSGDGAGGGGSSNISLGSTDSAHGSESGSNHPFNWRKVGRGALIEKLAGKKNFSRSNSARNDDNDGQLIEEEEETSSLKQEAEN